MESREVSTCSEKTGQIYNLLKRIRIPPHLVPLLLQGSRVSEYGLTYCFLAAKQMRGHLSGFASK